jgi:hypothetical protein
MNKGYGDCSSKDPLMNNAAVIDQTTVSAIFVGKMI